MTHFSVRRVPNGSRYSNTSRWINIKCRFLNFKFFLRADVIKISNIDANSSINIFLGNNFEKFRMFKK